MTFLLLRHFGHIKLFPHELAWQADIVGRESGLIRRLKFAIIRVVCRKKLHCVFGKHRWVLRAILRSFDDAFGNYFPYRAGITGSSKPAA